MFFLPPFLPTSLLPSFLSSIISLHSIAVPPLLSLSLGPTPGSQLGVCYHVTCKRYNVQQSIIPQGSVLGPILFLIFSNDLDNGLSNAVLKFADDTKLFRQVNNCIDCEELQLDLDNVCSWARRCQMTFNVSKCKIMHYGTEMVISVIIIA